MFTHYRFVMAKMVWLISLKTMFELRKTVPIHEKVSLCFYCPAKTAVPKAVVLWLIQGDEFAMHGSYAWEALQQLSHYQEKNQYSISKVTALSIINKQKLSSTW